MSFVNKPVLKKNTDELRAVMQANPPQGAEC